MNRQEWITELQHRINASRGNYIEYIDLLVEDAEEIIALLKEQEEAKTIICPKCGDEIEIKLSLLTKPDMEAIAKRDAFLSDKNGKKLNDAMQSLWGED